MEALSQLSYGPTRSRGKLRTPPCIVKPDRIRGSAKIDHVSGRPAEFALAPHPAGRQKAAGAAGRRIASFGGELWIRARRALTAGGQPAGWDSDVAVRMGPEAGSLQVPEGLKRDHARYAVTAVDPSTLLIVKSLLYPLTSLLTRGRR